MGLASPQMEIHEARAFSDLFRAAPTHLRQSAGLDHFQVGSGWGVMTSAFDILAFNRVTAAGVDLPVTDEQLDSTIQRYRRGDVPRFFFQVAPGAQAEGLPRRLEERGFSLYNNWVKLYRGVEDPPEVETDLRITRIGPEHAEPFAEVLCRAFEWPEALEPMISGLVGVPGWTHYLAFDGDTPAATAAMFTNGEWCWIDFASTAVEYRGRRAQPALITRRLRDAAELSCRHVIVETAEDRPDKPGYSCRNVQKMGFEIAYLRPNWLYQTGS